MFSFQGGAEIGQRVGLSDKDIQKLNKMYCDADSDSGQADQNPPKKTVIKKKKGKNKPFEGHGIGYHQGKAVAIKILPAPETYKLPDVPSFHVFDYFSKEPQILSTSENEGFRIGKEIAYSYSPPEPKQTHQMPPVSHSAVSFDTMSEFKPDHNKENFQGHDGVAENKQTNTQDEKQLNQPQSAVDISTHDENSSPPEAKEVDADLIDAFDRLSKIIKIHVYPSQTPDLSAYKLGHTNNYDAQLMKKLNPLPTEANKPEEDKMNTAIRFINNMYEEKYEQKRKIVKDEPLKLVPNSEDDVSPWSKKYEEEYYDSLPDYKPLEHYREEDEYTSLHSPKILKEENSNDSEDDWYQKFIQHYPDHDYHDYSKDSSEGPTHDGHANENIYSSSIPKRTQDYADSRLPAKVTKSWYNDGSHDDR